MEGLCVGDERGRDKEVKFRRLEGRRKNWLGMMQGRVKNRKKTWQNREKQST